MVIVFHAPTLRDLSKQEELVLQCALTRFHGELPAGVPLPPSLRILDLSGNAFSGAILGSLFTASSALQELYLSRNDFFGGVPPQLALLGALMRLELQHNALAGPLLRLGAMRLLVPGTALAHPALPNAWPRGGLTARRGPA